MPNGYHEIVWVREDELKELELTKPLTSYPVYFCVTAAGTIRFWPRLEPGKVRLLCLLEE